MARMVLLNAIIAFISLIWMIPTTCGKLWQGNVRLSPVRPYAYLANFAFDKGRGKIEIAIDENYAQAAPPGTKLLAVLDEDWDKFLTTEDCAQREALNRWQATLTPGRTLFKSSISQSIRPHVWYVVLSHCSGRSAKQPSKKTWIKLSVSFLQDARYGNWDQFSYEDILPARVIPLMWFVFTLATAWIGKFFLQRRTETRRVHPTLWMVLGSLVMHWLYLAMHTLHLRQYAEDGEGLRLLDVFGEVMHVLSQLTVSYVLVGLAYGWTLSSDAVHEIIPSDMAIVYLMAGCLGFIHLMFVILGRITDNDHGKSHWLDSWPAYFLIAIRLSLLGVFLVGGIKTFQAEHSPLRKGFVGRLVLFGTLWFAAMPALVMIASLCAEYIREPVVSVGVMLTQSLGLLVLSWLFLTRNDYYKMSSIASAGMLPTRSYNNLSGGYKSH